VLHLGFKRGEVHGQLLTTRRVGFGSPGTFTEKDTMFPKELYRNNHYRVVHCQEEQAAFMAKGWKEEMDRDRTDYVVHHSGVEEEFSEPEAGPDAEPEVVPRKRGK